MANVPSKALEPFAEADPWDRIIGDPVLGDEPVFWFVRFTTFRKLGPYRTLRKAYREQHETQYGPSERELLPTVTWYDNAKIWHWRERAEAWDQEQLDLMKAAEYKELTEGYALVHERLRSLKAVATKLDTYIQDPHVTRISPNTLEQYRGVLDDIARELGHRIRETRLTGAGGGPVVIETQWGRGGSATNAWGQLEEQKPKVEVTEVKEEESPDVSNP